MSATGPENDRPSWLAQGRLGLIALSTAGLVALGGCGDDSDDFSPVEPEVGEEDTEIVPGEGGPVD